MRETITCPECENGQIQGDECWRCEGDGRVPLEDDSAPSSRARQPPVDPWVVLRALRARPLVQATTRDEPINGSDAVDELCAIRAALDAALNARA